MQVEMQLGSSIKTWNDFTIISKVMTYTNWMSNSTGIGLPVTPLQMSPISLYAAPGKKLKIFHEIVKEK